MTAPPSVLIADDHPLFRRGLREVIEGSGRYRVIGEAADGPEAMSLAERLRPQICILDLSMPGADGFQVVARISRHVPQTRCVVMTMHNDQALADRALAMGVTGYLLKDDAFGELARCLAAVMAGKRFVSPGLGAGSGVVHPVADETEAAMLARLTDTQRAVLRHLADYQTSKEIARRMGLSHRTVENHRANIAAALRLRGPNRVLEFAVRNKNRL